MTFTGEIIGLVQAAPAPPAVDLDPGEGNFGVIIRVGQVEEGPLPQHMQDLAVFHLHSPTELFGRLGTLLAPPQGEHRFTLEAKALDFNLSMEAMAP